MQWYYAKRNDSLRRGVVDEDALVEMGRSGALLPSDLLWSEATGRRWVTASSVAWVFPQGAATEEAAVDATLDALPQKPPVRARSKTRWSAKLYALLALAVASLALLAFSLVMNWDAICKVLAYYRR
jgi:hypothetical protein